MNTDHQHSHPPETIARMHEHYVRATNAALEEGREDRAFELADAYVEELRATEARVA
jgi:hypothetical protein